MANNIKKLFPTDIISDSMDKINSNFDILSAYSISSDKSLMKYYNMIDELAKKIDITESYINIEFEKIRGDIKEYNLDMSSIYQTAEMIQSTVSSLNDKFDGTVDKIQSQFTQTAESINSVVQSYRDENDTRYDAITKILDGFQDQIDGNIETWYYEGEPKLNNEPVITWIKDVANEEEKNKIYEKHQGDLYYDRVTGLAYRFFKGKDGYVWTLIRDTAISKMLDELGQKAKIFTSQPTPPYNVGDMWITEEKDLFVCIKEKEKESGTFDKNDWEYATRYKMDLDDFKEKYQTDKKDFQNQIDGKIQYWFQKDDPSVKWKDDNERSKHINDLWYDTGKGITKVYTKTDTGYEWQKTTDKDLSDLAQSAKDGNITIFYGDAKFGDNRKVISPAGYKKGDLWYDCTYPVGTTLTNNDNKYYHDTLRCQTTQGDSDFAIEHWVPIEGGDRAFSRISHDVDSINLEVYGSSEDGKDSLRSLITQRVTVGDFESAKTEITNQITTDKGEILAKFDSYATNDKVNGVQSAVNALDAQINEGDTSIVSKLSQTATKDDVNKVQSAITKLENTVSENNTTLTSRIESGVKKTEELQTAYNALESKITTDKGEILAKFDSYATNDKVNGVQESVSLLENKIEKDNETITANLNLKASSSELDKTNTALANLQTRVGTTETTLTQQATEIGDVKTAVGKLESAIGSGESGSETSVTAALKVLTEKDKDHDSAISSLQSSVKKNGEDIASAKIDISANKDNITGLVDSIAEVKTTADNAASKLELKSVSDKANANETSISNLTTEIKGEDGKSGLKAGLENAVSRIGANETSISGLSAKIGDDSSGIISQINAQATDIAGVKTAQANMQSSINGHTASIKTMVTKDEMNSAISSITLDADRININAEHKLSIKSDGLFELISTNCTIDDQGNIIAKNANISGNITTNSLSASSGSRTTTINGDEFKISSTGIVDSSISITIIQDMSKITGATDAPDDLKTATNVPTLCMTYNGKKYYMWPGAWKALSSGSDNVNWSNTKLFSDNGYVSMNGYRLVSSVSDITNMLKNVTPSADNVAQYFIKNIVSIFNSASNINVSNAFMCTKMTGYNAFGTKKSSSTSETYNFAPSVKKLSDVEGTDSVWTNVTTFYSSIKTGSYVTLGKQCASVFVQQAYDAISTSGNNLYSACSSLGMNLMDEGYVIDTSGLAANILYSGTSASSGKYNIYYSDQINKSFSLDMYSILKNDIGTASGSTSDEKTITRFMNCSGSAITSTKGNQEVIVCVYPICPVSLGSVGSASSYLYTMMSSISRSGLTSTWSGTSGLDPVGGGTSSNGEYERSYYVSYEVSSVPSTSTERIELFANLISGLISPFTVTISGSGLDSSTLRLFNFPARD